MRWPIARSRVALAALVVTAALSLAWARGMLDEHRFPHRVHEKLFPTCAGCHAGILTGLAATSFPSPESCAQCHNGTDAKVVAWAGPSHTASNLKFDHVAHAVSTKASGDKADCLLCHGERANRAVRPWMVVQRAPPAECIACHAHASPAHLASGAQCETCHVPLVQAVALTDSAIAGFPKPPSHDDPDWIAQHTPQSAGALAQCATCHARESCARCHVNSATLAPVLLLASDARVARLQRGRSPSYPIPASHLAGHFAEAHGALAKANITSCSNCHAQSSCLTCHLGGMGARVIAKLPRPINGSAAGVRLQGAEPSFDESSSHAALESGTRPQRHDALASASSAQDAGARAMLARSDTTRPRRVFVHAPGFARAHGPQAAAGQLTCAGCHQESFCTSCHQGEGQRRYHPFNFVARHASTAYARETSCSSCHNNETFCRACHVKAGLAGASTASTAGSAHGAQPLWLLQHGQAARQGMQSCAGCHQQTDCLRCHSTVTQRVNPHGPDFDARRMASRNKIVCLYCHLSDPLK